MLMKRNGFMILQWIIKEGYLLELPLVYGRLPSSLLVSNKFNYLYISNMKNICIYRGSHADALYADQSFSDVISLVIYVYVLSKGGPQTS